MTMIVYKLPHTVEIRGSLPMRERWRVGILLTAEATRSQPAISVTTDSGTKQGRRLRFVVEA